MTKKVAIIGAGASGLTAIKCCLDENLDPVCFERTGETGGLWNFTQESHEGQACVMKSTIINTSKEMMCYSDFIIPKEYPMFMHNTLVMKYFNQYAETFGLKKHIRFNTEILSVTPTKAFEESGKWDLTIRDNNTKEEETLTFDGVLVCTGHHAMCNRPTFPGMDEFGGKIIHSHDYKTSQGYEDKRVVIVGIGNSAGDTAVELSRITSKLFLSTRRGAWVASRVADNGNPFDMTVTRRATTFIPPSIVNAVMKYKMNSKFDHAKYCLQPAHKPNAQHPNVCDELPNRIAAGSIIIKADIKRFTKTGVEFTDGTLEDNIDVVILATGYIFGFPFIDKSIIDVKKNKSDLFMYAFPPDLKKQTLAVVGFFQPLGALMPLSELQCRLATKVFKGEVFLPSRDEMWNDIHEKQRHLAQRYVQTQRHTIQVDWIPFADELAELIGCKPDLWAMLKSDPKLAWTCFYGPCTPYQYRLQGPGQWKGAREAIMTQWERTLYPLNTRPLDTKDNPYPTHIKLLIIVALIAIIVYYLIYM